MLGIYDVFTLLFTKHTESKWKYYNKWSGEDKKNWSKQVAFVCGTFAFAIRYLKWFIQFIQSVSMFFMPFQTSTIFDIVLRTSFISSYKKFRMENSKRKVNVCRTNARYQEKVITIIMISFSNEISQTDWKKIRRNFISNNRVLLPGANDESKNIFWNLENEWKYIVITLGIWWIADGG